MPLITCNECENQVSGSAKACPQCGAKGKALTGPKKLGTFGKVALGILGLSIVALGTKTPTAPPALPTPKQRADAALANKRDANIVMYARSLRAIMRDPESLAFERVLANRDGTLVCFNYRAHNGFGGVNRERVAFAPNGGSQIRTIVKAICSDKAMKDVSDTAQSLIETLK